ncbi:MAG: protein translocase subunit SecD [Acidobacteriota bacterium]
MRKNIIRRVIVILLFTLMSILLICFPRNIDEQGRKRSASDMFRDFTVWSAIKQNFVSNIRLGLDLKGGLHLLMRVQVDELIQTISDNSLRDAESELKRAGITANPLFANKTGEFAIELNSSSDLNRAREILQPRLGQEWQSHTQDGRKLIFVMTEESLKARGRQAMKQAMDIIDNRVDAMGVSEKVLQSHGRADAHQILLQLPGVADPERVKKLVNAQSKLELKAVIGQGIPFNTREEAIAAVTSDSEVLAISTEQGETGFLAVEKLPIITGIDMREAVLVASEFTTDKYEIQFSLNPSSAERFGNWTGANIGRQLAIVLDGKIKSWPSIQNRISDHGRIVGDFTKESAEALALTLNSGVLPARVIYLEERTVGPSLGADSIRQGITASIAGLILIMAFMVFYYRVAGLNAIIALLLNLIFLLAALALFKATLTLPGIAGIILTIGMAVDSNVLIFERIREELKCEKKILQAIEMGFNKAFLTIIDTHVTTVVSAFFLFVFGTGPIRGFAITLVAGLIANIFTATYVSKTIFALWLNRRRGEILSLSI